MKLQIVPMVLDEANAFVRKHHRHHAPESGASLRAAGWKLIGERGGGKWSRENRPRVDTHPLQIANGIPADQKAKTDAFSAISFVDDKGERDVES